MSETRKSIQKPASTQQPTTRKPLAGDGKQPWETPRLEDVSDEVMAQPYIRFT